MSKLPVKKYKNHFAITTCSDVAELMLPMLSKHGMTVFHYYRVYFDGSVIRLSSDQPWAEHFFKKDYLNQISIEPAALAKPTNYLLWQAEEGAPEVLMDAALNFDTSNGLTIVKRYRNYIEHFSFATTLKNTKLLQFYINNLDLLEQYCLVFKEKANDLIKQCEKDKIILTQPNIHNVNEPSDQILIEPVAFKLTTQQAACAKLILQGMKSKEIARVLNLSYRTVETYLAHLRSKLNCRNQAELIVKLISS